MKETIGYTYDDVMQAIACALEFASTGVGLAAQDVVISAECGKPSSWGVAPDGYGAMLMPGCGLIIHMSGGALNLLAMAQKQVGERCELMARTRGGSQVYDLRRGAGEST